MYVSCIGYMEKRGCANVPHQLCNCIAGLYRKLTIAIPSQSEFTEKLVKSPHAKKNGKLVLTGIEPGTFWFMSVLIDHSTNLPPVIGRVE